MEARMCLLSSCLRLSGFDRRSFQYSCHRIDGGNEMCFPLCRITWTHFAVEHVDLPSSDGNVMTRAEIAFPSVKVAQTPEAWQALSECQLLCKVIDAELGYMKEKATSSSSELPVPPSNMETFRIFCVVRSGVRQDTRNLWISDHAQCLWIISRHN